AFNLGVFDDPVWEMAIIKGDDKGEFGVNDIMSTIDVKEVITRTQDALKMKNRPSPTGLEKDRLISRGELAKAVCEAFPVLRNIPYRKGAKLPFKLEPHRNLEPVSVLARLGILSVYSDEYEFHYGHPVTKGEAVDVIVKAAVFACN
ncbi:MAG: hypothetical protein IJ597_06330, partial [Synergistaceae bacterium]|nr:hypothetical protein [Synergistaceae bacterium]